MIVVRERKVTDLSIFWIVKTKKRTWFEPRLSHAQCRSRGNILENCFVQAQSTRFRIFLNPQLFLSGCGFCPHVSGESGIRIRNFFNPLYRVEILNMPWNLESCGRLIRIFLSVDVTISSPVLYREYCVQDGDLDAWSVANFPRGALGIRVNPDSGGQANSIWIRIRVDVEVFETGKKKVADSKISGYVSYNSRFYSRLYVGIIKIPLRPTLRKQNLQAKEIHVLKNPVCQNLHFLSLAKKAAWILGKLLTI